MKRIISLVIWIAITTQCYSQLDFGIKGGVSLGQFWDAENDLRSDVKSGIHIGLASIYKLNNKWSLQPAIIYISKGGRYGPTSISANQIELQIPATVTWKSGLLVDMGLAPAIRAGSMFGPGFDVSLLFGIGWDFSKKSKLPLQIKVIGTGGMIKDNDGDQLMSTSIGVSYFLHRKTGSSRIRDRTKRTGL